MNSCCLVYSRVALNSLNKGSPTVRNRRDCHYRVGSLDPKQQACSGSTWLPRLPNGSPSRDEMDTASNAILSRKEQARLCEYPNRQGQAHIVFTAMVSPRSRKMGGALRTLFPIDPQPASISPTINISIVFICAFLFDCGRRIPHLPSKTILARSNRFLKTSTSNPLNDIDR